MGIRLQGERSGPARGNADYLEVVEMTESEAKKEGRRRIRLTRATIDRLIAWAGIKRMSPDEAVKWLLDHHKPTDPDLKFVRGPEPPETPKR